MHPSQCRVEPYRFSIIEQRAIGVALILMMRAAPAEQIAALWVQTDRAIEVGECSFGIALLLAQATAQNQCRDIRRLNCDEMVDVGACRVDVVICLVVAS